MNNIDYNLILNFLDSNVYNKSPRYLQIKEKYDATIASYGFSDDFSNEDSELLSKLLMMMEEEGRLCRNKLASDVYDNIDYWIKKQAPLSEQFVQIVYDRMNVKMEKTEKIIQKEKKVVQEVESSTIDLVRLLDYANGGGITRLLNSCTSSEKNTFLRMKPYNVIEKGLAIDMLEAMLEVAPKDKANIIRKALEVLNER